MTETCVFCGQLHSFRQCPMFGKEDEYMAAYAPKSLPPGEAKPSPSLAPTQFEQVFGRHGEEHLQEVLDHPDLYTHDEVNLAWELLSGAKKLKKLDDDDRALLDRITEQMSTMTKPVQGKAQPVQTRRMPERHFEDDEGPPRDDVYESLITKGQVDPSDG